MRIYEVRYMKSVAYSLVKARWSVPTVNIFFSFPLLIDIQEIEHQS